VFFDRSVTVRGSAMTGAIKDVIRNIVRRIKAALVLRFN